MTEQPTKGPLFLNSEEHVTYVLERDSLNVTAFRGPDREANTALFIRAQHMDELMKAVKVLAQKAEETSPSLHKAVTDCRAILAKIKGEK